MPSRQMTTYLSVSLQISQQDNMTYNGQRWQFPRAVLGRAQTQDAAGQGATIPVASGNELGHSSVESGAV